MKDSVSTYCHFWASGGGSVNRNKHNNRASPHPPKNIHRNTPLSQVPDLASTFGNETGSMVRYGVVSGEGTWKDGGVWDFHRQIPLPWTRSQVLKGQVCTGRRFPQKLVCLSSSAYMCAAELSAPPPLQMRDDLDVDKIFVLPWL